LKRKVIAIAAGSAALLSLLATQAAYAGTSSTVNTTSNVNGSPLSITAPTVTTAFADVTLNGAPQSTDATLSTWSVVDPTGTGNGWHVQLSASQLTEVAPGGGFASGTSALTLPTGSLALAGTRTVSAGTGSTAVDATNGPLIENPTAVIDGGSAVTIVDTQAGYGMGTYTINEPTNGLVESLSPSTTKVDTTNYSGEATPYSSTLTYSIVSGP
jgi:hypothetical protein